MNNCPHFKLGAVLNPVAKSFLRGLAVGNLHAFTALALVQQLDEVWRNAKFIGYLAKYSRASIQIILPLPLQVFHYNLTRYVDDAHNDLPRFTQFVFLVP